MPRQGPANGSRPCGPHCLGLAWSLEASVAQNIEIFAHALSGIAIIFIPDKEPKYRTIQLNTGHPAILVGLYMHGYVRDVLHWLPCPQCIAYQVSALVRSC